MSQALRSVAELVRRESGMTIGADRLPALAAAVERTAPGIGPAALVDAASDPGVVERLLDEVTINETFFFRNPADLEGIDWTGLAAAAAAGRREARVWSAGCATGEEAYTLAIMACEALGTSRPPISIVATDLSLRALAHARAGGYRGRSVRTVPDELRSRWLHPAGHVHAVDPALRRLVRFERHNLVRDPAPAPGGFDVVVCRNVLIYFAPPVAVRVRADLEEALHPEGSLVLGAADRLCAWADPADSPVIPTRRDGKGERLRRPAPPPAESGPPRRASAVAPSGASAPSPPFGAGAGAGPAGRSATLDRALAAANSGRLEEAIDATDAVLAADPVHAGAHFVRGVAELARGDGAAAAAALRRALYLDPAHALAAFKLGRSYDVLSQPDAARRAYRQALTILDSHPATRAEAGEAVDPTDVRGACLARLEALEPLPRRRRPGGESR